MKWTAPEALFYKKYSTSSDIWSYGMTMYEVWSLGCKPFADKTIEEVRTSYYVCICVLHYATYRQIQENYCELYICK